MLHKKISKLLFIVLIIFSFSVNSFAAISVADGSAFVTKAEFDSDFNGLSNRLSQVENSVDAKVDSLVSAYLARNGIWNGKKIEFVKQATIAIQSSVQTQTLTNFTRMNTRKTICTTSQMIKSGMLVGTMYIPDLYQYFTGVTRQGEVALCMYFLLNQEAISSETANTFYTLLDKSICVVPVIFATAYNPYRNGSKGNTGSEGYFNMTQNYWKFSGFVDKGKALYFDFYGRINNLYGGTLGWSSAMLDSGNFFASSMGDNDGIICFDGFTVY